LTKETVLSIIYPEVLMKVDRISINPNVCHGKPVIKNTRVRVSNILADLAAGLSYEEIIENYPNVTPDDIQAALELIKKTSLYSKCLLLKDRKSYIH
jgi:uncharacterized protein (DUF433 family)